MLPLCEPSTVVNNIYVHVLEWRLFIFDPSYSSYLQKFCEPAQGQHSSFGQWFRQHKMHVHNGADQMTDSVSNKNALKTINKI